MYKIMGEFKIWLVQTLEEKNHVEKPHGSGDSDPNLCKISRLFRTLFCLFFVSNLHIHFWVFNLWEKFWFSNFKVNFVHVHLSVSFFREILLFPYGFSIFENPLRISPKSNKRIRKMRREWNDEVWFMSMGKIEIKDSRNSTQ